MTKAYENFLKDFKYESFPLDIISVIKKLWITVDSLEKEELDGLCVEISWRWHIFYRSNMCIERKRFTLAHELKHFLEKENACAIQWHMRTKIEREANVFAWRLLVPQKPLLFAWSKYKNIDTLKRIFWVSIPVIKKRLEDENIIY